MLARSVPTVLFVRTYLRLNKGRAATRIPAIVASGIGFVLVGALVLLKVAPWPAALFASIMLARTIWLLGGRPRFSARTVGIAEMTLGIAMVLSLGIAWKFF
jgi:hypothetical protein